MSQVDGVSDSVAALWPCVEEGSERGQCHCLASRVLSRRKLSPVTRPNARYFNFSLYATGARPGAALALEPRGRESA